jgi:hypothetical protein
MQRDCRNEKGNCEFEQLPSLFGHNGFSLVNPGRNLCANPPGVDCLDFCPSIHAELNQVFAIDRSRHSDEHIGHPSH